MQREVFAGVMSGTSLDGIDAIVARFAPADPGGADASHTAHGLPCQPLGVAHVPFPDALRSELLALQKPGMDEIARGAEVSRDLADLYARAIVAACSAAGVSPADVVAAGVHGQTVRHRPQSGWTVQLNDGARVAERAGMTVVADLRSRDVAAGGQGAPLVPAFHAALFARSDRARVVLNLGGIANVTLLTPGAPVRGFDTGPGNVLLDLWCARNTGERYDAGGAWAARGAVVTGLLAALLAEPYFAATPPKSTGRDLFDEAWLDAQLAAYPAANSTPAVDVQATLVALTARTVADAVRAHAPAACDLILCGGGARNSALRRALAAELPDVAVSVSDDHGVAAGYVEALAFAWLAREALAGRPGNRPEVTGARGPRILGAIHPK